ncbi:MAG: CotH kinase family protein [Candidatus Poribacteria bacterium]|nr:CotH kinase family protein [Candidatus Poribacteria bacterium]
MIKWTLCLATILCFGIAAHSSAKELTLDDIFPTDRVIDVQITVSQGDWDTIRYQSRDFVSALNEKRQFGPLDHPYTYVEASVSIDGVVFPKVGIRKKGFIGSQSHTRPSLKIKLNHVDKEGGIEGLTNLTLNNNKQDTSQVSQFMGYALFNAIGSPAPRGAYAKVTVNGKSLGIYSHVETVRKPLLKRAFGNDDGSLYEGTVVDFHEEWENSFEHKRGDDTLGREKIIALIDVLADNQVTEAAVGELVDLDSFYQFWAIESLLGFWDGYSGNNNNYFIYLNPDTDKFHFLPWGADSLFTNLKMDFRGNAHAPTSVKTQGLIAYRLYQLETGRERYAKTMVELLKNYWNEVELLAELDRVAAMIQPYLLPEQREFQREEWGGRGGKQTFENQLAEVRDFIRIRKNDILQEIGDGMPVWRRKPRPPLVMGPEGFDMKKFIQLPEEGLWHAARTGDLQAMKRYISEGTDVNAPDENMNISPLAWSASHGQTGATRLLIENGADVNIKDDNGSTPLHSAAVFGRAEVAKLLVESGANLQVRNDDGATPADTLHLDWRTTGFIGGLMGVEVERENIAVMQSGRNEIAKLFGVKEFDSKDIASANDLPGAVFIGDLAAIKRALTDGADPNVQDPQSGSTMLSIASLMGHTEVVALLLEHGADVNAKSRDGGTPLHAAAFLGRAETVKLLLKKGADTTLRNNMGSIAIDGAKLDWTFTKGIIGMLQIEVDEAEVKAGRAEVIKLISRHSRK